MSRNQVKGKKFPFPLLEEVLGNSLIRVAFGTLGQKQRVLEPYSLSLSSMVAAAISQNPYPSNRLLWILRRLL
jgi:hypothetical protein